MGLADGQAWERDYPPLPQHELTETATRRWKVYAALNTALTGPSKDPRRRSARAEDRLEYLTDAVMAALDGPTSSTESV